MPEIKRVKSLKIPQPFIWKLSNGAEVYETNMGTQDIVRIEIVFFAGRPFECKKSVSKTCAAMLREGTASYSSADIAETVDFYGGTLSFPVGLDLASVTLHSLKKHFIELLPIVASVLSEPTFPQEELEAFIRRKKHQLLVDLMENDVVAFREFTRALYGTDHPYGYNSYPETYKSINRQDLVDHFQKNYTAENCFIFLSGKIDEELRRQIEKHLGKAMLSKKRRQVILPEPTTTPKQIAIPHPDAVQASVLVGRRLFKHGHEDFNGMYVLNTILGGYFGSRLSKNIREEKGYTYSIYSSFNTLLYDGYFYVDSDVNKELAGQTLHEIYREIEILQEELVDEKELSLVKNYILGNILTGLDGPFNVSEVIKAIITEGLPMSHFDDFARYVDAVKAEELRELARKYLQKNDLWEVVA